MKRFFRRLKRKIISKLTRKTYLEKIELLVKDAAEASISDTGGIDFDAINGIDYGSAEFHKAFTKLCHELRYTHYKGDGCLDHEH